MRGAIKCVSLARISLNYWDHPRAQQTTTAAHTRAKVERDLLAYLPPITLQWEHVKVPTRSVITAARGSMRTRCQIVANSSKFFVR